MTRRSLVRSAAAFIFSVACLPAAALGAQQPAAPPVTALKIFGEVKTPLSITPDELKAMPRTRVEIKDENGQAVKYEGVLVGELLKRAGATLGPEARGNAVAT